MTLTSWQDLVAAVLDAVPYPIAVDPPPPWADLGEWHLFAADLRDAGVDPQSFPADWPAGMFDQVILGKFNPAQRRDARGRWSEGGGGAQDAARASEGGAGGPVAGGPGGGAPGAAEGAVQPGETKKLNGLTTRIQPGTDAKDVKIANAAIKNLDPAFVAAAGAKSISFGPQDCGTQIGQDKSGPGVAGLTSRETLRISVRTGIGMNPGQVASHELGHAVLWNKRKAANPPKDASTVEVAMGKNFTAAHAADKASLSPSQNAKFKYFRNREEAAVEAMSYAVQTHGNDRAGFRAAFPKTDAYVRSWMMDQGFKVHD